MMIGFVLGFMKYDGAIITAAQNKKLILKIVFFIFRELSIACLVGLAGLFQHPLLHPAGSFPNEK